HDQTTARARREELSRGGSQRSASQGTGRSQPAMEGQVKPDHFWQDLRVAQDNALEQSDNVRTVRERMPSRPPIEERRVRWPLAVAATLSLAAAVVLGIVGLR